MVYLLKIVIFHGYVRHNQMVNWIKQIVSAVETSFRQHNLVGYYDTVDGPAKSESPVDRSVVYHVYPIIYNEGFNMFQPSQIGGAGVRNHPQYFRIFQVCLPWGKCPQLTPQKAMASAAWVKRCAKDVSDTALGRPEHDKMG